MLFHTHWVTAFSVLETLNPKPSGLSLTEPNRGIIIETCVELMDGDEAR